MIQRVLFYFALLPLSAFAQLQLFVFDGAHETPVGAIFNVGAASPGDMVETRFKVRNTGIGPATLDRLSLAGTGFTFSHVPSLPYILAPDAEVEFDVVFGPTELLTYITFLDVDSTEVILQGTGTPSAVLKLDGSNIPLAAGAIIDFGAVASGQTKLLTFDLSNPGNSTVTVKALSVTGSGFKGPIGATAPIAVAPRHTVSFEVAFQPVSGQASQATLTVDQRSFTVTGQGLNPPLPGATIVFGSSVGHSAQQNNVSIPLAAASKVSGTGTLTMTFQSEVDNVKDDPAIQFLSGPLRQATVSISAGDKTAKFTGNQGDLVFQTGTTAGTISFDLTLNGSPAGHSTLPITRASVNIEKATSVRRLGELDVSVTAFDNTYSSSELAFTFFDKSGATMQPGVIRVDASSNFRLYFGSTQAGGMFGMLATFPVSGDTSQIAGVSVAITNSIGVTTTERIPIGN